MGERLKHHGGSVDERTVQGFGYEWRRFDQSAADPAELERLFAEYFALFPWEALPPGAVGFDLGCGSGRWARIARDRVGALVALDASSEALEVAVRNAPGCPAVRSVAGALPFRRESMDFGYSLGVLHHVPDPLRGLVDAVGTLKPGAPFLVYVYYALDNRPAWFRKVWRATDFIRAFVSRSPDRVRYAVSQVIALGVYLPFARTARFLERRGLNVEPLPLSAYRDRTLYTMRTDALDRFGTPLEKRFTRAQLQTLLQQAGLDRVRISDEPPFWCALGFKPDAPQV